MATEEAGTIATPVGITADLVAQGDALWHVDYGDNDYSDDDPRETGQLVKVEVPDCVTGALGTDGAVFVGSSGCWGY